MSQGAPIKPAKRSVALSGVVAGNTALCTVGRTGNDLHYRGYDILDIAERCPVQRTLSLNKPFRQQLRKPAPALPNRWAQS